MEFDRMNKNSLWSRVTAMTIGVLVGLLLWLVDAGALARFIFVLFGLFVVASGLPGLVAGVVAFDRPMGKWMAVMSALTVVMGLVLIFYHGSVLLIILGVYLIIFPLVEVITAKQKWAALNKNLYKFVLGIIFVILGPAQTLDILFDVAGWSLIALSVLGFLLSFVRLHKKKNTPGSRIFADTTGDGKIDTVFFDTTGDGKADSASDYRKD